MAPVGLFPQLVTVSYIYRSHLARERLCRPQTVKGNALLLLFFGQVLLLILIYRHLLEKRYAIVGMHAIGNFS